MLAQHRGKRVQPTGRNNRIVVEKNQDRAASEGGTTIATTNETDVGVVAQEANAGHGGERNRSGLRRRVIDDQNLVRTRRRVRLDALAAGIGQQRLAVHRQDNRNSGILAVDEREWADLRLRRERIACRGLESVFAGNPAHYPPPECARPLVAQYRDCKRKVTRQLSSRRPLRAEPG